MAVYALILLLSLCPIAVAGESSCEADSPSCTARKDHDSSILLQKSVDIHSSFEEVQTSEKPLNFNAMASFVKVAAKRAGTGGKGDDELNAIWSHIQDLDRNYTNVSNDVDGLIHQLEDSIRQAGQSIHEGHSDEAGELKKQADQYDKFAFNANIKTICETGFNAGHSAARFLFQSDADVYEFDLGKHDYAKTAESFLKAKFPSRLQVTWGDSTKTLPEFHAAHPDIKCDLAIVDGGHNKEVADADLKNFASMASSKHYLLIDDTPCNKPVCQGPTQAWADLVQQGCIQETMRIPMDESRGFTTGFFTPCPLWPKVGEKKKSSQDAM